MPDTFTPIKNFNPRSREGSDVKMLMSAVEGTISIHAPAKGATTACRAIIAVARISIHAPAKGATMYFAKFEGMTKISIHAPAKGATFLRMVCKLMLTDFNPRSREGSDSIY